MKRGVVRIGISGWTYAPWRGAFYPCGLPRQHELHFAADHFQAIEVNGTFYGLEKPDSYRAWCSQVGADFNFAIRGPRLITHILRLQDVERPLANFMASGVLALGAQLGPILWQFPKNMRFDPRRMAAFLALLPRDTEQAAALATRHDHHLRTSPRTSCDYNRKLRHALEVRNDSFLTPAFLDMLRAHNAALAYSDGGARPRLMDVTADFVYCRLHGAAEACASGYNDDELQQWAVRAKAWARGDEPPDTNRIGPKSRRQRRDVFIFFDNDRKVRAPANALELIRRLRS